MSGFGGVMILAHTFGFCTLRTVHYAHPCKSDFPTTDRLRPLKGGSGLRLPKALSVDDIRVSLKRQFAAFDSLVVCKFFRQTETP